MLTSELRYELPDERIATHPAEPRDSARLMVVDRVAGIVEHRRVSDIARVLSGKRREGTGGDLLVVNESKVLPARIGGVRLDTGGKVTGLYLDSVAGGCWKVMLESRGKLQVGERIGLGDDGELRLVERLGNGEWLAEMSSDLSTVGLLEKVGKPPLPPYILKQRKAGYEAVDSGEDVERYNTVYARELGSVAAPTAGLHFTEGLLGEMKDSGFEMARVTLHVGLGTFAPVRTERLEDHPMHSEHMTVPGETLAAMKKVRDEGGRIIAVGTTSVRALESLPADWRGIEGDYCCDTRLYVMPKEKEEDRFEFRFTDVMMTNFHLPESTLLALVAALPEVGIERLMGWYREAIEEEYRFYSYGDAMLLV